MTLNEWITLGNTLKSAQRQILKIECTGTKHSREYKRQIKIRRLIIELKDALDDQVCSEYGGTSFPVETIFYGVVKSPLL